MNRNRAVILYLRQFSLASSMISFFFLIIFTPYHPAFGAEDKSIKSNYSPRKIKKNSHSSPHRINYKRIRTCLDTYTIHKDFKEECLYLEYTGSMVQLGFRF